MNGVLLLLAHPDDETFFAAGTIALLVRAGIAVDLVCATRGERGATANLCTIEDLPLVREAEVRAAAKVLGMRSVQFLSYQDQQLASAPPSQIRTELVEAVRKLRPHVVITFDPMGSNQHPDHIAIHRFAMDAILAAGDMRWLPDSGPAHQVDCVLWNSPQPVFELGRLPSPADQPGVDFLVDIRAVQHLKEQALRSHATQWPGLRRVFFEQEAPQQALAWEAFRLGWTRPGSSPSKVDIFSQWLVC